MAPKFGEDDGDLWLAHVRCQFVLDILRDIIRGPAPGHDITDQRYGNLSIWTHGRSNAQFRTLPDRDLHYVIDPDVVFLGWDG
ncbi:hypothetical protein GCM10028795_19780 [Lysobacter olei]